MWTVFQGDFLHGTIFQLYYNFFNNELWFIREIIPGSTRHYFIAIKMLGPNFTWISFIKKNDEE